MNFSPASLVVCVLGLALYGNIINSESVNGKEEGGDAYGCFGEYLHTFEDSFGMENSSSSSSSVLNTVNTGDIVSLITDNTLFLGVERDEMVDFLSDAATWKLNSHGKDGINNNGLRIKDFDLDSLSVIFSFEYETQDDNIASYNFLVEFEDDDNNDDNYNNDNCGIKRLSMVNNNYHRRLGDFDCPSCSVCQLTGGWCCVFCCACGNR